METGTKNLLMGVWLVAALLGACTAAPKEPSEEAIQEAIAASQRWQFALAQVTHGLLAEGHTDLDTLIRLAAERTAEEEKNLRESMRAMGYSRREVTTRIREDRRDKVAGFVEYFQEDR